MCIFTSDIGPLVFIGIRGHRVEDKNINTLIRAHDAHRQGTPSKEKNINIAPDIDAERMELNTRCQYTRRFLIKRTFSQLYDQLGGTLLHSKSTWSSRRRRRKMKNNIKTSIRTMIILIQLIRIHFNWDGKEEIKKKSLNKL